MFVCFRFMSLFVLEHCLSFGMYMFIAFAWEHCFVSIGFVVSLVALLWHAKVSYFCSEALVWYA